MERLRYTNHSHPASTPSVDIIMVQVRPLDHPWVQAAVQSVSEQTYPLVGLVEVDNRDRELSIGAAWNAGVQHSSADLVLMMGDDDMLSVDLVGSMVAQYEAMRDAAPNAVHLSSMCTLIDEHGQRMAHAPVQHTGMFLRKYLLDFPFDAGLSRHVGRAKVASIEADGRKLGQPMTMGIRHHYGYIWRQHPFMNNGSPIAI